MKWKGCASNILKGVGCQFLHLVSLRYSNSCNYSLSYFARKSHITDTGILEINYIEGYNTFIRVRVVRVLISIKWEYQWIPICLCLCIIVVIERLTPVILKYTLYYAQSELPYFSFCWSCETILVVKRLIKSTTYNKAGDSAGIIL
jgi:hypothetical protein